MARELTYETIKAHLVTTFTPMPVIDFDTIDTAMEQQSAPFICLEDVTSDEEVVGFGDPDNICVREESAFLIHAFVPAPESARLARNLGDRITAALRLQYLQRVRVVSVSPPEMELQNDGLWTASAVTLMTSADFHEPFVPAGP